MEANFFRYAAKELAARITGMRIEKIFNPASGTFTIDLGSPGYLILHVSPSRGFFFLSPTKPDNKYRPSGQVMWLRKRTRSRRILQLFLDWPVRQMAWLIGNNPPLYMLLDLHKGISLVNELPPDFGKAPGWPTLEEIGTMERIWETYPHITPPVRHALLRMDTQQGQALLARLQQERPWDRYWVLGAKGRSRLGLWDDGSKDATAFETALAAAERYGSVLVAGMVNRDKEQKQLVSKRIRHLNKALKRVERDQSRLQTMITGKEYGRLLQANLYHLDGSARLAHLDLYDATGEPCCLQLDPRRTVLENMARFFAKAKKGERGLPIVQARKLALQEELRRAEVSGHISEQSEHNPAATPGSGIPEKYRRIAVNLYRTSDGFLLIRGRNQKANHQLLSQLAGSHDYWFHAQDGPGAHVILKRDFSSQKVPRTSLEQAAIIAARSSWQKQAPKAQVIFAQVKNVRTMKGAAWGQVRVQQMEKCLLVPMDESLEERLKID
ncbi:MAG: hypothetical protein CSA21_04265 [Deltaproteobacteria bacterium]|nr:MAG: hypothetical protein CSA21_04265 [Deltaproteobacteria bacterium]